MLTTIPVATGSIDATNIRWGSCAWTLLAAGTAGVPDAKITSTLSHERRGRRAVAEETEARLLRQEEPTRIAILVDMDRQRRIESGPLKQTAEHLRHKVRERPRLVHEALPSADIAGGETVATKIVEREEALRHVGQDSEPTWR